MNEQLPQWLAARLAQPLPGPMVGSRFEPHPRPWRHYDVAPPDARPAAVLHLALFARRPVAPAPDLAAGAIWPTTPRR